MDIYERVSEEIEEEYAKMSNGLQTLNIHREDQSAFSLGKVDEAVDVTGHIYNLKAYSYACPFPNPFGDSKLRTFWLLMAIAKVFTRHGISVFKSDCNHFLVKDSNGRYHDLYRSGTCMLEIMLGFRPDPCNVGYVFSDGTCGLMPISYCQERIREAGDWIIRSFLRNSYNSTGKEKIEVIYKRLREEEFE